MELDVEIEVASRRTTYEMYQISRSYDIPQFFSVCLLNEKKNARKE